MTETRYLLAIPLAHPAYAGHFPGHPILPGVVLLDHALQLLAAHEGLTLAGAQIKSAKFLSPVLPGEKVSLRYESTSAGVFRFQLLVGVERVGDHIVDERIAASGILAFSNNSEAS